MQIKCAEFRDGKHKFVKVGSDTYQCSYCTAWWRGVFWVLKMATTTPGMVLYQEDAGFRFSRLRIKGQKGALWGVNKTEGNSA